MATRRHPEVPDLKPEVIAILLAGWSAPMAPEPSPVGFSSGLLDLFDGHTADIWTEHEQWLREKARQWGWEPSHVAPDGRRVFYGELCVIEGRER